MLKFRTNKPVSISIHTDDTAIIEFRYNYKRPDYKADMFIVRVDAYAIDEYDNAILLPDGCKTSKINQEELETLMDGAEQITPTNDEDTPLAYFERLIESGIKIVLTSGGYYKDVLTLEDFD